MDRSNKLTYSLLSSLYCARNIGSHERTLLADGAATWESYARVELASNTQRGIFYSIYLIGYLLFILEKRLLYYRVLKLRG